MWSVYWVHKLKTWHTFCLNLLRKPIRRVKCVLPAALFLYRKCQWRCFPQNLQHVLCFTVTLSELESLSRITTQLCSRQCSSSDDSPSLLLCFWQETDRFTGKGVIHKKETSRRSKRILAPLTCDKTQRRTWAFPGCQINMLSEKHQLYLRSSYSDSVLSYSVCCSYDL